MELPSFQLLQSLNKIDKPISLIKDKDKLIIVGYVYIKNLARDKGIQLIHNIKNYLESNFDDTVKVLVMPVLTEEKQGIEVLNPIFADNSLLDKLNEYYEKLLKLLEEKSFKND